MISCIHSKIVLEDAYVGEAAREAEDLAELAPGRGEEDAEDPGDEECEHRGGREGFRPRQRGARPGGGLRLAPLGGRRVVLAGARARGLDVAAREQHGGGGDGAAGDAGGR